MSAVLREIQANYGDVYEAKKKMHEEFFQKGRINGAVSVIYYPIKHGPGTHTQLEVQGMCYTFRSALGPSPFDAPPEPKSYDGKMCRIRRALIKKNCPSGKASPLGFVRTAITVTPQQLQNIEKNIEGIRSMYGLTCMHAVKRVLDRYTDFSIPFPISLFPTPTLALFGLYKKFVGSTKVHAIEPHLSHRATSILVSDFAIGSIAEGAVLGFLCYAAKRWFQG